MSLNKPAAASTASARWYLWDGGFLAVGRSDWGVIPPHSHHAIQIVVAIDGEMAIKGARGDWRTGRGIIVRHDVEHSYDGRGALGAMIFVDPESYEGVWLQTALARDIAAHAAGKDVVVVKSDHPQAQRVREPERQPRGPDQEIPADEGEQGAGHAG